MRELAIRPVVACFSCATQRMADAAGERWCLLVEPERRTNAGMPPVFDFKPMYEVGAFCCEAHALTALGLALKHLGADDRSSDHRPIETCPICDGDFETATWHWVVALMLEHGFREAPEQMQMTFFSRLCPVCAPKERNVASELAAVLDAPSVPAGRMTIDITPDIPNVFPGCVERETNSRLFREVELKTY